MASEKELRMDLVKGNKYTYTNTVRVGRTCKRMTKQQTVIYTGSEENKEVFETESGVEIVLHKNDIDKLISK